MSSVDDLGPAGGTRSPAARPTDLRAWIARIESLRRAAARLGRPLGPGNRRDLRDQLPPQALGRAAVRRHRRLPARVPRADRFGQQRAPDGGDARPRPGARHDRAGPGAARQAASSGKPPRRASSPMCSSVDRSSKTSSRVGRRPHSLSRAALARTRRRPLHRHRRRGRDERPRHRANQRRRLSHDDPGGRPFGDHQRRGGQAGPGAVRALVREAGQSAGAGVVRPRPAAADGRRHRGARTRSASTPTPARWSARNWRSSAAR